MRLRGQQPLLYKHLLFNEHFTTCGSNFAFFFGRLSNIPSGVMFAQLILAKETCCRLVVQSKSSSWTTIVKRIAI